jgi:hypothetical protein
MDTLALSTDNWDLTTDAFGNLATVGTGTPDSPLTGAGMRLAQGVASRIRAWRGEVYYDTTQGIDYPRYLGGPPNLALLQSVLSTEALLVPECATALANLTFTGGDTRAVGGTITLADTSGNGSQVTL